MRHAMRFEMWLVTACWCVLLRSIGVGLSVPAAEHFLTLERGSIDDLNDKLKMITKRSERKPKARAVQVQVHGLSSLKRQGQAA